MAEFNPNGEWHKRRCPQGVLLGPCSGGVRWGGDGGPRLDYGPRREFVGRTCAEVFAEEEERRAAAAPAEWRVVTEGLTQDGDRCATHPNKPPVSEGLDISFCVKKGCVIERRVPAEPAAAPEAVRADFAADDAADAMFFANLAAKERTEPAAAPEEAVPAEQVVGVKAWSLTLDRAADAADATGFAMLAVKQPDWIPYKPTPDAARDLWEALDPQYAEDAALGRLMRTVQERKLHLKVTRAQLADHGDSILKALAFAAGRAVLEKPHVPQYVADAALSEREDRLAQARGGLAMAQAMNAEGGVKPAPASDFAHGPDSTHEPGCPGCDGGAA